MKPRPMHYCLVQYMFCLPRQSISSSIKADQDAIYMVRFHDRMRIEQTFNQSKQLPPKCKDSQPFKMQQIEVARIKELAG
jgi:hypothetical protein